MAMPNINYSPLSSLDQHALLALLNKQKTREHLVPHAQFDLTMLAHWVEGKLRVDATQGCRVRGVTVDGAVAGWCAIQFENDAYELAIVLDDAFWGLGVQVFKGMMGWAAELGHDRIVLHLLHTRPEYRALKRRALRVFQTEMFGQSYTSYELPVPF